MGITKSKFDVTGSGQWDNIKSTLKFSGYVVVTFIAWAFYGWLVRKAYKKAADEGRTYYVDHMPSGNKPQ
jgi:hypothetical protein